MQGAQKLRSEAYIHVRCNDEVEAQRSRWTFYETIKISQAVVAKAAGGLPSDVPVSFDTPTT
jgi:hypothetical protein